MLACPDMFLREVEGCFHSQSKPGTLVIQRSAPVHCPHAVMLGLRLRKAHFSSACWALSVRALEKNQEAEGGSGQRNSTLPVGLCPGCVTQQQSPGSNNWFQFPACTLPEPVPSGTQRGASSSQVTSSPPQRPLPWAPVAARWCPLLRDLSSGCTGAIPLTV